MTNAVQSKGLPVAGSKEPDVNGLPLSLVDQWQEYQTKRTFAVSVSTELRRQHYLDDTAFGKAMRKAGYVPVRTRKLTGKRERFWLYRVTGNDKGVGTEEPAPHKAFRPVVQTITKQHKWFKRVALNGKWQYVYADHVRFLTKKRHRVDGVRVQGYTAAGLIVEVIA